MFVPWSQLPGVTLNLAVRTQAEPAAFGGALHRAVAAIDANLPIYEVRTMEERLSDSVAQPRFTMLLHLPRLAGHGDAPSRASARPCSEHLPRSR